ncbi:MAG: hypothetical protein L3K19_00160 [Thermoplasmata archaeon]|nr:hypothetical protein [Thermoplasmata archaeon]
MADVEVAVAGWDPDSAARLLEYFEEELARRRGEGTEPLLRVAIRLFRQSIRAYIGKAVDLAAMGCRATIENAGYAVLTHRRTGPSGRSKIPPGDPDRPSLYTLDEWEGVVAFGWIIRELRDRKVLDSALVEASFVVKDHGDGVAHFEARSDRTMFREFAKQHTAPWVAPSVAGDEAGILIDLGTTARVLLDLVSWDIAEGRRMTPQP